MPIHPDQKDRYPKNWAGISLRMRQLAGWKCEGSPDFPHCRRENGEALFHLDGRETMVVVTVAHLDHTPENSDPTNLRVWCQRCHLAYDAEHHANERRRRKRDGQEREDGQQTIACAEAGERDD